MSNEVQYIDIESAAVHVQNQSAKIIDVRGTDEFNEGHLPNAIHAPSQCFEREDFVSNLLETHGKNGETLIFHCMHSQQRGPKCAGIASQRLKEMESKPEMLVQCAFDLNVCIPYP